MARGSTFSARSFRDRAVVLRHYKLAEADRIVVLLTQSHGQVRAVAKGVRRTSSRFGAVLEPGMVIDAQFAKGRNLDTVTQAQIVEAYGAALSADYVRYSCAAVMVEVAEKLTRDDADSTHTQFTLLYGALNALANSQLHPFAVLDSYILRSLAVAGWAASFAECVRCGIPGPHRSVNVPLGGAVCPGCRPAGSRSPSPEVMDLLDALNTGEWERVQRADQATMRQAGEIVTQYVQWHLERSVKSLSVLDRAQEV